jgi:acetate kinase
MRVLTLNCGSSSVKFSLFETSRCAIARAADQLLVRGLIERIGQKPAFAKITIVGEKEETIKQSLPIANHDEAIQAAHDMTINAVSGDIHALGHRVVHGGPFLNKSRLIDDEVEQAIEACIDLAPLHNPHNLSGIRSARRLLPTLPSVAVFDTGFHRTIPPRAYSYALPKDLIKKHSIRRYGFHGISHRFITYRLETLLKRPRKTMNIISCHLGNGCSIAAIAEGRSIDTTMGFTPCEGLVMGTRPGDVDIGAIMHLMAKEDMTIGEVETLINRRSGLLGLSGISNDFRDILAARARGNEDAALATDVFCYRIRKYIGAFAAVLGHIDAIAFTGGIGESLPEIRARAVYGIEERGVELDQGANEGAGGAETRISTPNSKVAVWVIPANEELVIARDTVRNVEDAGRVSLPDEDPCQEKK